MGKKGQPQDQNAWEAKRQRAWHLLELGYSQSLVARSLGASTSWVQRIDQERKASRQQAPSTSI